MVSLVYFNFGLVGAYSFVGYDYSYYSVYSMFIYTYNYYKLLYRVRGKEEIYNKVVVGTR